MAIPVLIIGRSGTGKSTSLRNCVDNPDWNLIRVLNKPLPFKGKITGWNTDNYQQVMKCLIASKANKLFLAAQVRAKEFYEKQGYTAIGREFLEEYCPHIWMYKTLS